MCSFIFKTSLKLNKGFILSTLRYIWYLPPWGWGWGGGGGRPAPPPELKFLIWSSSRRDQQKFILEYKLSFLWKFQPDWPTLRGGLIWSGILWYSRYLHSLNLYYGLDMYFWENTPPKFTLVGTPVAENMVFSLRFALIEKIPAYPDAAPRGYIHGFLEPISHKWHHWYSWCNPKTYAIRFSMCQVIFGPNFMVTDQYLVLVWADLHVFSTNLTAILGTNNFCSDM